MFMIIDSLGVLYPMCGLLGFSAFPPTGGDVVGAAHPRRRPHGRVERAAREAREPDRTIDANRLRSFKQAESRCAHRPVVATFAGPAGTTASCASADSSIDPAAMAAAHASASQHCRGRGREDCAEVYRRERGAVRAQYSASSHVVEPSAGAQVVF